jgi:hypothetical protein
MESAWISAPLKGTRMLGRNGRGNVGVAILLHLGDSQPRRLPVWRTVTLSVVVMQPSGVVGIRG